MKMETNKKAKLKEQYNLSQEIVSGSKINIVTCGYCSSIILHRVEKNLKEIECHYCGFKSDPCDFPDLFCI